jgi:small subunit ribosomal protein S6
LAYYESVFIARQEISSAQVEALADALGKVVEDQGGQIAKREYWGLRALAHRIKKNRKGHYVLFNLDAPPPAVVELERQMRINEDVLRFLTVRVEALEAGPSIMLQSRGGRGDERGRREGRSRGEPAPAHTGSEAAGEARGEPARGEPAREPARERPPREHGAREHGQ